MIEILFALHFIVLLVLFRLVSRKAGRIIGLVYSSYLGIFTVLKPVLLYYYGLFFPYSTDDPSAVQAALIGSLLFLAIQVIGINLLADMRAPRLVLKVYDFEGVSKRGLGIVFATLAVVSFVGSTIKFGTPGYIFSDANAFDAAMNQAGGSWYINVVADALFSGMLMLVSCIYLRYVPWRSALVMVATLFATYIWVKAASRTGVLVVVITWMACYFPVGRQKRINILYIAAAGYALLILLYVGNLIRIGSAANIDPQTALFGAVVAAGSDLSPVDNAVLLYSEMDKHPSTDFEYLAGSILPTVLIPSALIPFKPPANKDEELTRLFFPDGADTAFYQEGSTLTFTIPASGYADAGYFGAAVASTVYVALFCFYLWIFRQGTNSAKFIATYQMLVHIIGYRLSIESLLVSFYISLMFFALMRFGAFRIHGPSLARLAPARLRGTAPSRLG